TLTGIDERRATIDPGCKRCAIRAVAQRDIPQIVALLRALRGSQRPQQQQQGKRRRYAVNNAPARTQFHVRLSDVETSEWAAVDLNTARPDLVDRQISRTA